MRSVSQNQIRQGEHDVQGLKNNCVNANNPEKRTKAKNAAKQGNAGERPDAAARYTVKSSGVNLLLFYFTGIFQRINYRGLGCLPQWGEVSRSDRGVSLAQKPRDCLTDLFRVAPN